MAGTKKFISPEFINSDSEVTNDNNLASTTANPSSDEQATNNGNLLSEEQDVESSEEMKMKKKPRKGVKDARKRKAIESEYDTGMLLEHN